MSTADQSDDFEQLHALITNTADIKGFLDGMTGFAAAMMTRSTGHRIECAVTLNRGPELFCSGHRPVHRGRDRRRRGLRRHGRTGPAPGAADRRRGPSRRMQSRTAIDLACGIIMAQNRCSQDQAFEILRRGSSTRNQKLHALAEEIVAGVSGAPVAATHFED